MIEDNDIRKFDMFGMNLLWNVKFINVGKTLKQDSILLNYLLWLFYVKRKNKLGLGELPSIEI